MESQVRMLIGLLFIFLSLNIPTDAQPLASELGTLIVTYQTDQASHRLDRIHFWLINAFEERTLYPKNDEFVSSSHASNERTVVISHLPAGNYRIEFLIPNTDQLFEEVPSREVHLAPEEVVKIDQTIRLRFPHLSETPHFNSSISHKVENTDRTWVDG